MKFSASVRARPRSDGSFAFDVRYRQDGKSRSQSFNTERDANTWAKVVRQVGPDAGLQLLKRDIGDDEPTVSEYAETYIASKSGVEGKTIDHYRMYMRLSIGPAFGDLPISAVTPENIAAWVNAQAHDPDEPKSAKTIKNRHGFLSAMMQHAVDRGVAKQNPCRGTRMPETEHTEMVFLSPDEFATVLDYVPAKHQPLILLLAATGLRWGEATALRSTDFDIGAGTVRVSRAWKSSKERGWYVGPPKTRRSKRTVSLPPDLIPHLRPLLDPTRPYVFLNRTGGPMRQQNFYEAVWNPARRLANGLPAYDANRKGSPWGGPRTGGVWDRDPATDPVGKLPRIHDLRHSHASWLINAGVPLPIIQRRLGHESITTTVDRYGHLAPDNLALAAQATGVALAGSLPQLGG